MVEKLCTENMYEITRINKQEFKKLNVEKFIIDLIINDHQSIIKLDTIIKNVFNENIKSNNIINKNTRIGISLKISGLENDIHIEYSSIDNIYNKIKSIHYRIENVSQSNKIINIKNISLTFTILKLKR